MNPTEYASDGRASQERLQGMVTSRLGTRIRGLRLVFQQAGVVLRGWSETYDAQHAVRELTGVPILANKMDLT